MAKADSPHRWFAVWRRDSAPNGPDAADLGTAFGLDLSLQELPHEAVAAHAATPVLRSRWVHRLRLRRKPAA